jgi:hypothetical protein
MLSLNERHRTELSTLRPRRSRLLTFRPLLRQRRPARAIARFSSRELDDTPSPLDIRSACPTRSPMRDETGQHHPPR